MAAVHGRGEWEVGAGAAAWALASSPPCGEAAENNLLKGRLVGPVLMERFPNVSSTENQ